jgi:hypothetical protein
MGLTPTQKLLLEESKLSACEMGDQGRSLTHLVGVLAVCDYLNLEWLSTDVHDAVSSSGERIRIKAIRMQGAHSKARSGRMNKFGRRSGYNFDMGVFVALDRNYDVVQVWVRNSKSIEGLESSSALDRPVRIRRFISGAYSPERFVDVNHKPSPDSPSQ